MPKQNKPASDSAAQPPVAPPAASASAVTLAAISGAQRAPTLEEHEAEKRQLLSQKEKILLQKEQNLVSYGKVYAYGALGAMGLQVAIADYVFYLYGHHHHWQIPEGAIQVWLAATVVEVIGIVLVIAKSLFPSDDFSISLFSRRSK